MGQSLYEVSCKYCFTFSLAQYVNGGGEFFIGNYILQHLLHSSVIKALSRGFSNSLKMCGLVDLVPLTLDLLNTKSIGFDIVEDYYCDKFQVIPIRGFHFIMLTC